MIWNNIKDMFDLQEIIYGINLKFAKEFISGLSFNENPSTKKV